MLNKPQKIKEPPKIQISKWELKIWLCKHGDRTLDDLKKDIDGYYVLMADGFGEYSKVYIP